MGYLKIMQDVVMEYIEQNADKLDRYWTVEEIADEIYADMFDVTEYTGTLGLEYSISPDEARELVLANIDDVMVAGRWATDYSNWTDETYDEDFARIGFAFCSGDFQLLDSLARHAFLNDAVDSVVYTIY